MIAVNHKMLFVTGATVLLSFVVTAAYLSEPLWLAAPVLLLGLLYGIQYPHILFYVLLFSIPWSTEYNFSPELGTDLPDEPLMLVTAITTICLAVYHYKKLLVKSRIHPLVVILLLQLAWLFFTVLLSSYFTLSAKYFLAKTWYLLAFVGAPLFLWRDDKIIKHSILILFVSMLGVTMVTIWRHASFDFTFTAINDALKPFFRNHVNYSALLVMMLPIQFVLWHRAKTKTSRLVILLSFFVTLPALYFSFARGAWLALVSGMLAYWLLQKKILFQSFLLAIVLVIASVFWLRQEDRYLQFAHDYNATIFHQNFGEHLEATYRLKDLSTAERFHRWIAGVRMIEDSWQTGFGPATFYHHYKSYTVPAFKTWVSKNEEQSTVHNYFLLLLTEQGIIGLLLFLVLVAALFWYAQNIYHRTKSFFWKKTTAAIAAILVMQCTLNFLSDLVETDKAGSLFYLCVAGLIIADMKTKISEAGAIKNIPASGAIKP